MGEKVQFDEEAFVENEPVAVVKEEKPKTKLTAKKEEVQEDSLYNCLRNEKVTVQLVNRANNKITDKRHLAFGGMMESAIRVFTVPTLASGTFKNVLTNDEKDYLEHIMGLEPNALSIHNKKDNFWKNYTVTLTKRDNILDLSDPEDYIRYKVLLANKDLIAPSMEELKNYPKRSYQFVIVSEGDTYSDTKNKMTTTFKCFEEFGKIKENYDKLKFIVESIDGRTIANNTKIEFLQNKLYDIIQSKPRLFLDAVSDKLLDTKMLIHKAVEEGIISKRGDGYYLREDRSPLCEHNEDPTITVAAKFLSLPKNQELKFSIEAKLK